MVGVAGEPREIAHAALVMSTLGYFDMSAFDAPKNVIKATRFGQRSIDLLYQTSLSAPAF
jgi:hypothetical protein